MMKSIWNMVVRYFRQTDKVIWGLCLTASAMSVVLLLGIWNSDYVNLSRPIVQCIAIGLGCGAMFLLSRVDYQTMADLWRLHVPLTYGLVLLTFILGVGRADDMAWIEIPFIGLTFQPSELLKLSFIITFASHLQKVEGSLNQPEVLVPVLCHMALPTVLIMLQGDDGSALIFLCIGCGMLFAAGIGWKYILAAGGAAVAALPVIWYGFLDEDKRMRFITLFNPELDPSGGGYQQRYGRIALGSGKLWGKGIFSGNHQYVPEMYNDFIFSFIGEALGFIGCLAVLGIISALCLRVLQVGRRAKDRLGRFICVGVFSMIAAQTVMNVGMCLSVLPVIGVTLPLFSGGGTSVVATYLGIGLAMSVSMHNSRKLFTLKGVKNFTIQRVCRGVSWGNCPEI